MVVTGEHIDLQLCGYALSNKKKLITQCCIISSNKNVDIKFSAHGTFLDQPSSGTLK
jgi:hypothetical protein